MIANALNSLMGLVDLGGPVVAILMVTSIIGLACILWKGAVFVTHGVGPSITRGFGQDVLIAAQRAAARGAANGDIRDRLDARLQAGLARIGAGLRLLDVIAQTAPLLGLFGTVLGMIDAFRTLQEAGGAADPTVLAGGIWVALVTTAAGLIVAMPASLALNWFDARLEAHEIALKDALEGILAPDLMAERTAHSATVAQHA